MQNPHDADAHYADKGKKQWVGYKVHVVESVDPEEPAKKKGEPTEQFYYRDAHHRSGPRRDGGFSRSA